MLGYTTYSEAGGVGKTTLATNLAVAHARAGLDVLVVPLDPQDGDLSYLLGVDDDRADSDADHLVRHMIDRPAGNFDDLVETVEGVDIIPEHNALSALDNYLQREKEQAEDLGEAFGVHAQLSKVLRRAKVEDRYDVLICDPPATESPHLYNAINATRNLVIPVEPSQKGRVSVDGLEALVGGLEDTLNIDVGVLAAVPMGFADTNDQQATIEEIPYTMPEMIRQRQSLFEGCWSEQCSAFRYVREHRTRTRDHELDTLAKLDHIARSLEREVGIDAPNSPEPGDIEHRVVGGEQA